MGPVSQNESAADAQEERAPKIKMIKKIENDNKDDIPRRIISKSISHKIMHYMCPL